MSLWKIAWRSIQQRSLASVLTAFSMALGVALVVAVLIMHGAMQDAFQNNNGLGYNLVVGAKGGKLQLVLNTVYYLSSPVENVPYSMYQEFTEGKYKDYTEVAVPVCLGDYYKEFRVIGTTPAMFDRLTYDSGNKYTFAAGRNYKQDEFFTAVIGSTVARETGLKVGSKFSPTHGAPDGHEHDPFTVIGILDRTGTPNDRGLFVNMEGFYLLEDHAKPVSSSGQRAAGRGQQERGQSNTPSAVEGKAEGRGQAKQADAKHAHHDHAEQHEAHEKHDEHDEHKAGEHKKHVGEDAEHEDHEQEEQDDKEHVHKEHAKQSEHEEHAEHAEHGEDHEGHAEHDRDRKRDPDDGKDHAEHAGKDRDHEHTEHHEEHHGEDAEHEHADQKHAAAASHADDDHDHTGGADHPHDHSHAEFAHHHHEPLPLEQREVTAILVRTVNDVYSIGLRQEINEGAIGQAVLPVAEMRTLFDLFVTPLQILLLVLTILIVVVSGISILVSIYNSMSERRHEIAVMRALGAGRRTVMLIVLLESILLSLGGGLIGWFLGHALIAGINPWIAQHTGVSIGLFEFVPYESAIIPGLIFLAALVGYLPALAAYRTDVAKALTAAP